jgi:hypothetical protein
MVGQKRLLLGIEVTLFGILAFQTLAVSGGGIWIGAAIGLIGLLIAIAGTLTPASA